MSLTQKQKDYHLRKMKTRMSRMDVNKDGYFSREDFEALGKRLAEYGGLTKEQADSTCKEFLRIADVLNLKPGEKVPLDEAAQQASTALLGLSPSGNDPQAVARDIHDMLFDAIDTNKSGHISVKEFQVYFKVFAPHVTEAQVDHCFKTIDANKNGKISREEFFAAAKDFFQGVEETELSNVFFGPLID